MNRDNYIRLLEKENQEYFEKAIKQVKDCCCHEIPELNDEINELLDDLNDMQADWAESNVVAGTAMLAMATEISRVTEERDKYQRNTRELGLEKMNHLGKIKYVKDDLDTALGDITQLQARIAELKEENYNLRKRLFDLEKQVVDDSESVQRGKTKPQLDPDFINEGFAITFNSELEYWSFMELCWGANLEWASAGDPRKSRPKELFLMAHAVACIDGYLEFATPVYYECELGYEIIKASDYLGVYQ